MAVGGWARIAKARGRAGGCDASLHGPRSIGWAAAIGWVDWQQLAAAIGCCWLVQGYSNRARTVL